MSGRSGRSGQPQSRRDVTGPVRGAIGFSLVSVFFSSLMIAQGRTDLFSFGIFAAGVALTLLGISNLRWHQANRVQGNHAKRVERLERTHAPFLLITLKPGPGPDNTGVIVCVDSNLEPSAQASILGMAAEGAAARRQAEAELSQAEKPEPC